MPKLRRRRGFAHAAAFFVSGAAKRRIAGNEGIKRDGFSRAEALASKGFDLLE
ncbi:MAG: hypothetical protein ACI9ZH_001811, partial [Paracoccaceae bacterium]